MSQAEISNQAAAETRETAAAGNAVEVRDLRKRFDHQQVLDGITLDFPAGQITTIVGPSGSGKTVLLKHLNLLLRPDSGTIVIDGVDGIRHAALIDFAHRLRRSTQARS